MNYIVITFRSRTATMGFYRYLLLNGISAEIVNTPKEAQVGCGLSVKTDEKNYGLIKTALPKIKEKSFVGIFYVKILGDKKSVRRI